MDEVLEVDEVALAIVLAMPMNVLQRGLRDTEFLIEVVRKAMPGESATLVDGVSAAIQRRLGVRQ